MRLHTLELRDFRGVGDREVSFDSNGVTVVVGDNETGKSSMLEALGLLFDLPDDSKAGKLRAVQPMGRDVGTHVAAEISFGNLRMHYRKQWFRQRATELRIEPAGQTWTGREAHDEAARLFAEHVDQTLWSALAVGQEHSLVLPIAGSVAAVLTALDEKAGGEVDHAASVPLVSAVESEYLRYFTPTGRPTGEYSDVIAQRAEAEARVTEAEARLAEVEQDVSRAERMATDRIALAARVEEQTARVDELEERRHVAAELTSRVDRLRRDADLAHQRLSAARGDRDRRAVLVAATAQREDASAAAVEVARETDRALRAAERGLDATSAELRTAREDQTARRLTARRLDAQLARLRDGADLAELEARLAGAEAARADERRRAAEVEASTVDQDALDGAESAHRDVLAARAARAAGAPKIVVRRLGESEVEVTVAGEPFTESEAELVVERDTTVTVAGEVEVSVHPGAGAAELAAACEQAEHAERTLLTELDATDIADVRRQARARDDSVRALTLARETLARRLDGDTLDTLVERRDLLTARIGEAADGEGASDDEPALPEVAEEARAALLRARDDEAAAGRVLTGAEEREALARKQFETASGESTAARVRAEQELERRDDSRAALAAAREAAADATLAASVLSVERELAEVEGELAQAEEAFTSSGVDRLEERLVEAAGLRSQLANQVEELHDGLRRIEGRLEMAGVQGLASAVEQARADLAHTEARHEALERRAMAAGVLRETLARHRADARRRYSAPLRERIEALGRIVHGPTFGVQLGDDLEVRTRSIDGVALPVASLSTGAREQLATLVRLAIAGLTATDGSGAPVVLDDALGWSDPARLEAMGSLLARAGTTSQVILLTCVPDRYAGSVSGARIVRI